MVSAPTLDAGSAAGDAVNGTFGALEPERASAYRLLVSDRADVDRLIELDADLAHRVVPTAAGIEVDVIATPTELAQLTAGGFTVAETLFTPADAADNVAERAAQIAREEAALGALLHGDEALRVIRADRFESADGSFISVEAYHEAGVLPTDIVAVVAQDATGAPVGSGQLSRFTDAGQYMYHRGQFSVSGEPATVTVIGSSGNTASADVREWVGNPPEVEPTYLQDFIGHYMDPTEVYDRTDALAAEYPDIAEIVELPYETNGYAMPARAVHGSASASQVLVISNVMGHEGGNDITVAFAADGADAPLTVTVDGSHIDVSLATDAAGLPTSTAAEVATALTSEASDLVEAHTYRGNAGDGAVETGEIALDDGLDAPEEISREPWTVRALRIRGDRENTRTGVLIYSQEHAREWVTPLVAVEAAERLVRNYGSDPTTTALVDELDIFIIPSVNPDGSHYSFYDYNFQRKSLGNHCEPENLDPGRSNSWGVDLNRNFSSGSRFDGYSGASASCTSGTYSGPFELSEPEARNEIWLTEQFPNIRFGMNTHSYGNYFMWPPGAYKSEGREPLPRPTLGEELYFWEAGEHILDHVKSHRGTVVTPARTGPVIDVLYSAAGNSADEHWYHRGIFGWDFEVGDIGFQPSWEDAHEEAMEFASGIIGLLEVARDFQDDDIAPTSSLLTHTEDGSVHVTFTSDEPATIRYTVDGSAPTEDSPAYDRIRMRELAGETIVVPPGTTVNWYAVDMKGNVEGDYDPATATGTHRTDTV